MRPFYTYLHCKPDGEPFYVGKGFNGRAYSFSSRNKRHQNTVSKYGKENIKIFVFPCDSEIQAFNDEVHQIAQLRREGFQLCNITSGGEGISGLRHSLETRSRMSSSNAGKRTGHRHSEETRKKMSLARIEVAKKGISEETRGKLSASAIGNTNGRLSSGNKNAKSWNKGQVTSNDVRKKISESMKCFKLKQKLQQEIY